MLNAIKSFILAMAVVTIWTSPATILDDAAQIIANELSIPPGQASMPGVTVLLFDSATSNSSGTALAIELRCLAERIAASGAKAIAFDYIFPADSDINRLETKNSVEVDCFGVPLLDWVPPYMPDDRHIERLRRIGEQELPTIVAVETASHLYSVVDRITFALPDPTHVLSEPANGALSGTIDARIDTDAGRTRSLFLTTPLNRGEGGVHLPSLALATWLSGHATEPLTNEKIGSCLNGIGYISPELSCTALAALLERLGPAPQIRFNDPKDTISIRLASSVSATASPNCGVKWDDFSKTCSHWFRDRIVIVGPARITDLDQHTTPLSPPLSLDLFVKPFSPGSIDAGDMPGAVIIGLAVEALDDEGAGFIVVSTWGALALAGVSYIIGILLFRLIPKGTKDSQRSLFEVAFFVVVIVLATAVQASVFVIWAVLSVWPAWAIVACTAAWVTDWFLRRTDAEEV